MTREMINKILEDIGLEHLHIEPIRLEPRREEKEDK